MQFLLSPAFLEIPPSSLLRTLSSFSLQLFLIPFSLFFVASFFIIVFLCCSVVSLFFSCAMQKKSPLSIHAIVLGHAFIPVCASAARYDLEQKGRKVPKEDTGLTYVDMSYQASRKPHRKDDGFSGYFSMSLCYKCRTPWY